ncbi:unnamed protein product [Arabidopsis arenosa]|uniref:Uncharacterized protein n=1 Tax=Arabidopsis arenosa TaxID=38785 RepID=A0A8S1ZUM0_ARAAE|nr:unnamed protein product [Arabidopsis arenosa]
MTNSSFLVVVMIPSFVVLDIGCGVFVGGIDDEDKRQGEENLLFHLSRSYLNYKRLGRILCPGKEEDAREFLRDAATVMLSGQVSDGFATIFIGELAYLAFFKPVAVHCIDAYLTEVVPKLAELGAYLSFSGWFTFIDEKIAKKTLKSTSENGVSLQNCNIISDQRDKRTTVF